MDGKADNSGRGTGGGQNVAADCHELVPIGIIRSCFSEKFGIPRQPGMVRSATARLELHPPWNREETLRGLEQFSHIWVHFLFHQAVPEGWNSTVRPPWLGGKKRVGVFASRSPHRPNHMGLSAVRLERVVVEKSGCLLELSGVDFLDGTPVFDIKPYIPYSDCIETASCGYGHGLRPEVAVRFSGAARDFCRKYQAATGRDIQTLVEEILYQDPRPASQKTTRNSFGMLLWDVNVRWRVEGESFVVDRCELVTVQQSR
ncbi:MAG: tRNA (N6-threonylcarbamoyladenosine(37)-N6)-methyltransferase TrmO [Desulforhopalus sp.]